MAIFEIEANGKTYEVEAPDQASALKAIGSLSSKPQDMTALDVAKDVGKSGGVGLVKGLLSSTVGLPGVAEDLGTFAYDQTLGRLANRFLPGGAGTFDARGAQFYKNRDEQIRQAASQQAGVNLPNVTTPGQIFNPANAQSAVEKVTGEFYKPQTKAGEYAGTIGEFAGGAIPMGGMGARNLFGGAVAGAASEGAGQMTKGTAAEPWARLGGAIVGGGATALATGPSGGQRMLQQSMQGVDDATLNAAKALMDDAAQMGVSLTWSEALNKVTGGANTRLAQIQRTVEESVGGSPTMGPFMAQRPGQVQQAGTQAMDTLGLPGARPTDTGMAVNRAARGTLDDTRQGINDATRPLYAASETVPLPPQMYQAIRSEPMYAQALAEVRGDPSLNAMVSHLPDNSIGVVNLVTTRLQERAKSAADPLAQGGVSNIRAANLDEAATTPRNVARTINSDYDQALTTQAQMRQGILEPMQEGQIGQLSQTTNPGKQAGIILPTKPVAGSAQETEKTIQLLVRKDPKAAQDIIRSHAETLFNEAIQNNMGGANQAGGAKFAAVIAGNPEQRRALQAAVEALPAGETRWAGFNRFLEVMEATGQRLPANSATAAKTEINQAMKQGNIVGEVASSAKGGFLKIPSILRERYQDYVAGRSGAELASILTDPAAIKILSRLAKTPPDSPIARNLAIALIQTNEQRSKLLAKPSQ